MTIAITRINGLVLDYLVVNGLEDVARQFAREAGIDGVDFTEIGHRSSVAELLLAGQVEAAIDKLNELDAYFLDTHADIYFALLELYTVELAREALPLIDSDPSVAGPLLDFAQSRMVPFIHQQPVSARDGFLERLEAILALVCFPLSEPAPEILGQSHRRKVAQAVNQALLQSQGQQGTSQLTRAIKTLVHTEFS